MAPRDNTAATTATTTTTTKASANRQGRAQLFALRPHLLALNHFARSAGGGKRARAAFDRLKAPQRAKLATSAQKCARFLLARGGSCSAPLKRRLLRQKPFYQRLARTRTAGAKERLVRGQVGSGFFDVIAKGLGWLAKQILNV